MSAVLITGSAGLIYAAAQPSHDWAAGNPHVDFTVNANGTLTLLEATRQFCPEAVCVFASTNKVYGDRPNELPLDEFDQAPRVGAVYNIGGGRFCNCSMLEAITLCEKLAGKRLSWQYVDTQF